MSEENRDEQAAGAGRVSPSDMAEALSAIKSSNPELGAALDAANLSPEDLAGAHGAASDDENGQA
jgi:hypothetical protein